MKRSIQLLITAVVCVAGIIATQHILLLGHHGLFALGGLLPAGTNQLLDLDRIKKWSRNYFRRVQSKIIFGEAYTGSVMTSDGPKPSDVIIAPPIYQVNDLSDRRGNVVTFTLINPLFPDSQSRLKSGRVKGQKRVGSERSGSKDVVQIALASWFLGVKEEDVQIGKQIVGMGDFMNEMIRLLSDNAAQYMDDSTIISFLQGASPHLYQTIAKIKGLSDGTIIQGSDNMGVKDPSEHPNTYAWVPNSGDTAGVLKKADSNSTDDIHALYSEISSDYSFSYDLLSQIALRVRLEKIVGSKYNFDSADNRTLVKVICDPLAMERLRQDLKDNNAFNSAYQATGAEHPLIKQGDILFGPLLVTEQEKLYDDAFSPANNFNPDEDTIGTAGALVEQTSVNVVTDTDGVERISTDYGQRTFATGTTAGDDTNIGAAGADTLGHIMVLGGNSLATAPGPVLPISNRTEDDYDRIVGVGSEHLFGTKRLDFTDLQGNFDFNQSSFKVVLYRGK